MGWTTNEKLFMLFEDGRYVIFSRSGKVLCATTLFEESLSNFVCSANRTEEGFVAFTKNNTM